MKSHTATKQMNGIFNTAQAITGDIDGDEDEDDVVGHSKVTEAGHRFIYCQLI